jgi:hypothetical protein
LLEPCCRVCGVEPIFSASDSIAAGRGASQDSPRRSMSACPGPVRWLAGRAERPISCLRSSFIYELEQKTANDRIH